MQYAVQLPKSDYLSEHPGRAIQGLGLLHRETYAMYPGG